MVTDTTIGVVMGKGKNELFPITTPIVGQPMIGAVMGKALKMSRASRGPGIGKMTKIAKTPKIAQNTEGFGGKLVKMPKIVKNTKILCFLCFLKKNGLRK